MITLPSTVVTADDLEIAALISTLYEASQRLEHLTGSQVDTVSDGSGQPFLLQGAQVSLRLREAAKEAAILDALPANIALIDRLGVIVAVNDSWRHFGDSNALHAPGHGVGVSYLDTCDAAVGENAAQAHEVGAGIRAVLSGEVRQFSIEYPCHSPTRKRWFLLTLTPYSLGEPNGAVVMHLDITARVLAGKEAERALLRLGEAQRVGRIGDWEYDVANKRLTWSPQVFEIFGRDPALGPPRNFAENAAMFDSPSRAELRDDRARTTIESGGVMDYELVAMRPDGESAHVHVVAVPERDPQGNVVRVYGTAQDVSARKKAEAMALQLSQQFAATLNSITDALFTLDRSWCFTFINPEAERQLARNAGDLLGHELWTALPAAFGIIVDHEFRRAMTENVSVTIEEFFAPLGKWLALRAFPSEQGLTVYFRDVSARRLAAEALRASEAQFHELAEAMPQIVWVTSADGTLTYLNQQWMDYTGLTLEESLGEGWNIPFHPDDQSRNQVAWQKATSTLSTYSIECRLRRADGAYRWWLLRGVPVLDTDGRVIKWFGTSTDIHDLKQAELEIALSNEGLRESAFRIKRLNRVYAVLSQINALIVSAKDRGTLYHEACRVAVEVGEFRHAWIGDVDAQAGIITPVASAGAVADFFESAPREIFEDRPHGLSRAWQAVRELKAQVSNDFGRGRQKLMKQAMEARGIHSFAVIPLILHGKALGVLALYAHEAGFFDEAEMRLLRELADSISMAIEHMDKQDRLDYLAYYDDLTGLANQRLFLDRLGQHMRSAAVRGDELAIFLIDIERFKSINDSLGWHSGDALLKQVAVCMTGLGGDANLFARVGADHFAAVLPNVKHEGNVVHLLEQSIETLGEHPFELDGAVLRIATKVGVAMFPGDGDNAETLFQHAEAALKAAKANGDRYLFYASEMSELVAGKLTLENQLRGALDNGEFLLHYQPKMDLHTGKVTGAEALIRWNDPRTGLLVPPGDFIPVLEETGLIHEVGRWALHKAIEDYLRWSDSAFNCVAVAVNVSAMQLRNRGFVDEIARALAVDARAAAGLELEITESMIMGDIKHGIASLQGIRALGVSIALDDFGTGFSSLSYLARLPIDSVKIDRSFINDMTATQGGLALVSAIVHLAHALKHKVVAEGVETEEQSRLLRLIGCDELQGHIFGMAVPCAEFERLYLIPDAA